MRYLVLAALLAIGCGGSEGTASQRGSEQECSDVFPGQTISTQVCPDGSVATCTFPNQHPDDPINGPGPVVVSDCLMPDGMACVVRCP